MNMTKRPMGPPVVAIFKKYPDTWYVSLYSGELYIGLLSGEPEIKANHSRWLITVRHEGTIIGIADADYIQRGGGIND